jgi:hypothetical protein
LRENNDAGCIAGVRRVVRIHCMDLFGGAFALKADTGGKTNTTTSLTLDVGDVTTQGRGGRRRRRLSPTRIFSAARTVAGA